MYRTLIVLILVSFFGFSVFVAGGDKVIFTLNDPRGDDQGDGSLVYPSRSDLKPGDLDLVSFSARAEDNGTMFEATFAKRIAIPEKRAIDAGGTTLDSIARLGFYTFNIDVYIDTDRDSGSGSTSSLPGRMAQIASENAWERMILVTPRPHEAVGRMKTLFEASSEAQLSKLKGRIDSDDEIQIKGRVAKDIRDHYFVPTQIRVLGSKISFLVPNSFLGGPAQNTWSYVVAVSAANLTERLDLASIGVKRSTQGDLMIVPVTPGPSSDSFGGAYDKDDLKPPLVDIIVPAGMKQADVLKNYNANEERFVSLPGVVPAEVK